MKEQPTPVLKHYEGDHLDLETRERMLNTLLLAFGTRFTGTVPAIDQLTWKLEDPPGLPSVAVLGELDGQVVITETNLRRRFRIHGETQPVREGADSSTHPDYQGRGFSRPRQAYTNAHVKPAFALTFSLFTNPIAIHTNARLDAQRLGNGIRTFTYQQHPFRIFRGSGVMGLLRGTGALGPNDRPHRSPARPPSAEAAPERHMEGGHRGAFRRARQRLL